MVAVIGERPLRLRKSSLALQRSSSRRARAASSSIDAQDASADASSLYRPIALESVDVVPLPRALVTDDESSGDAIDLAALPPMADQAQEAASGGFQLDKAQSFWLLNIVAALGYGPNTVRERLATCHRKAPRCVLAP